MAELFIRAVLGHLIGDYLIQSKKMAIRKSEPGAWGAMVCTIHVTLYTTAVCLMMQASDPLIWILVFLPHWVIDRWSLGEVWLHLSGGRTRKEVEASRGPEREIGFSFYGPLYMIVDGTLHFLCLWAVIEVFMV